MIGTNYIAYATLLRGDNRQSRLVLGEINWLVRQVGWNVKDVGGVVLPKIMLSATLVVIARRSSRLL
jgi:hypothetical protein